MVAVKSVDADAFVRKPPDHLNIFLVYGADAGAVADRAAALSRHFASQSSDEFSIIRLEADALAKDPGLLVDEAQTIGLFGGRRFIRVDARPKSFIPAIELLLEQTQADYKLILEAGDLRRDAPLRRVLEREPSAALIECRPDTPAQIERLIDEGAAVAGLDVTPGGRHLLASLLGADRLTTRAEIEKVVLYARGLSAIDETAVAAIAADAAAVVTDQLLHAAFNGERERVTKEAARTFEETDPSVVLLFALRHAFLLLQIALDSARGGAEAALDRHARGFPPSKRAQLAAQLKRWTPSSLIALTGDLGKAISRSRTNPKLAEALALRALWEVTRRAVRT